MWLATIRDIGHLDEGRAAAIVIESRPPLTARELTHAQFTTARACLHAHFSSQKRLSDHRNPHTARGRFGRRSFAQEKAGFAIAGMRIIRARSFILGRHRSD